jgi:hypothetical protein
MYCSPASAVILGAVVAYLGLRAKWAHDAAVIGRSQKTIDKVLKDPHASEEQKAQAKAAKDTLNSTILKGAVEDVKQLEKK